MTSEPDVIWVATLDKRFHCRVERTGNSSGTLIVNDEQNNQQVILTEAVGLSYGAAFGPDVDDVMNWQGRILAVLTEKGLIPKEEGA